MPGWTLAITHPTQGRTFRRPLDVTELQFFRSGILDGSSDFLQYCELRLLNGSQDEYLFSEANVTRAWMSTKRRFPLAGATVRNADNTPILLDATINLTTGDSSRFASEPHFFVGEHQLSTPCHNEIILGSIACAEEAQQHMTGIMSGPRRLSPEQLMQLYVFRETGPKRKDVFHLIISVAHCVTDRVAISTFLRCLLDTLARGGLEPDQLPLEERLAMVIPSMDLLPVHLKSLSPAIRRWRRAVGKMIIQSRMAKWKGGHTLPCRLIHLAPHIAARSQMVSTSFTTTQTASIIANCRLHGITFGNAYLTLAQVAMTRVLYRRYLRGDISEQEWLYRKRQPQFIRGPINLRPYQDKTWIQKGGGGEVILSLNLYFYQLPFMTLGASAERHQCILLDGAPPFSDLLSFDRFLHRVGLVKKQATALSSHPLFFELLHASIQLGVEHTRLNALQRMRRFEAADSFDTHGNSNDGALVSDVPMISAFYGSSAGSLDLMSPAKYPLPPTHPLSPCSFAPHPVKAGYVTPIPSAPISQAKTAPKIVVENSTVQIREHPGGLYLTADSMLGQLNMYVSYDSNVFKEGIVQEWLAELKEAVLWYLGQTHPSRRVQAIRAGDDGRVGLDRVVQAKL